MTDEEYVRSVWDNVQASVDDYRGFIFFTNNALYRSVSAKSIPKLWTNGAEFTRNRLEQVRQLRRDAKGCRGTVASIAEIAAGQIDRGEAQRVGVTVRALCSACRILARLDAELARLTAGIKPEALEAL